MLAYIKFGHQSQNCQTAKLKPPPNVPRIQYLISYDRAKLKIFAIFMCSDGWLCRPSHTHIMHAFIVYGIHHSVCLLCRVVRTYVHPHITYPTISHDFWKSKSGAALRTQAKIHERCMESSLPIDTYYNNCNSINTNLHSHSNI